MSVISVVWSGGSLFWRFSFTPAVSKRRPGNGLEASRVGQCPEAVENFDVLVSG